MGGSWQIWAGESWGFFSLISAHMARRNEVRGDGRKDTNRCRVGYEKVKINPHLAELEFFSFSPHQSSSHTGICETG